MSRVRTSNIVSTPAKALPHVRPLRRFGERLLWITALAACSFGIREGYLREQPVTLFLCLAAALGAAAVWLTREDKGLAAIGWQVWQRCAAAGLMFTVIEFGFRLYGLCLIPNIGDSEHGREPIRIVTFEIAQGDPLVFTAFWKVYQSEWHRHAALIQQSTPQGPVPFVYKPNTSCPFFEGRIDINSLGLSGREIAADKGDKFRIVVMGSSHVVCAPLTITDTSWPAKLERLIREHSPTGPEIEVLNAGVTGYTMMNNLHRLREVVLPLKPDLIITYFGYNEFRCFQEEFQLPRIPPSMKTGGSILIGKLDSRYQNWLTTILPAVKPIDLEKAASELANCRLAREYRKYLDITREHGVPLVVCNFNLAVNDESPDEVIRFYEQCFPEVRFMIQSNRLNTAMLPLIIRPKTGARLIRVQDGLDGVWKDNYADLVHLAEAGKQRLAENVFREIRDLLPQSLKSDSHERPARVADRPNTSPTRF